MLFPDGEPVPEEETKPIRYLKCTSCTINIGPGHLRDEVWLLQGRPICQSCGERRERDGAYRAITKQELRDTGGGVSLVALIKERTK